MLQPQHLRLVCDCKHHSTNAKVTTQMQEPLHKSLRSIKVNPFPYKLQNPLTFPSITLWLLNLWCGFCSCVVALPFAFPVDEVLIIEMQSILDMQFVRHFGTRSSLSRPSMVWCRFKLNVTVSETLIACTEKVSIQISQFICHL